ncbi:hypothetical protein KEM55_007664, partial [Ascosphaera atra]
MADQNTTVVSPNTELRNPFPESSESKEQQQKEQQSQSQPQDQQQDQEGPDHVHVPASRSSISDASQMMHSLSINPLRASATRRASRNSFGASLPIPRSPRGSRVASGDRGKQATAAARRSLLASQLQDTSPEQVAKAKNMAFAFDID